MRDKLELGGNWITYRGFAPRLYFRLQTCLRLGQLAKPIRGLVNLTFWWKNVSFYLERLRGHRVFLCDQRLKFTGPLHA